MLKPRGLYKFYRTMPHYSGKKQQKEKPSTQGGEFHVQIKGILHSYVVDEEFSGKCPSSVRWSLEDKVVVYDGMNCLGMLSVSSVIGSGQGAKLKGKLKSPAYGQSSRLTMVLGKGVFVNDVINDEKVKDFSMQDGSNAPYVAYAVVDYDPNQSAMTGVVADFHPVISVLGIPG